jgi:hypothetical protein
MAKGFTTAERRLCDWQYERSGSFFTKLFDAMSKADNTNLNRLGEGFPDEVEAFKRYRDERGWWQGMEKRWEKGER